MGLWSFVSAWSGKFYSGVVVESVTPPYYAVQGAPSLYPFSVLGSGFDVIPSDAVAIIAIRNENPLEYLHTLDHWASMAIEAKEDDSISFRFSEAFSFANPLYIGAIVSADRSQIYWVNNTEPLP